MINPLCPWSGASNKSSFRYSDVAPSGFYGAPIIVIWPIGGGVGEIQQTFLKNLPHDFSGTQAKQVVVGHLAIDEFEAPGVQMVHQMRETDFGSIVRLAEHRLSEENPSHSNTI